MEVKTRDVIKINMKMQLKETKKVFNSVVTHHVITSMVAVYLKRYYTFKNNISFFPPQNPDPRVMKPIPNRWKPKEESVYGAYDRQADKLISIESVTPRRIIR